MDLLDTYQFRFVRYIYLHFFVLKTCLEDVFSVTIFRLPRRLQDVFKTSSRRFQDVFARRLQESSQDVFKTSWKTKNCYAEYVLKTSSRHVSKTSSRRFEDQQMFAGYEVHISLKGIEHQIQQNILHHFLRCNSLYDFH